MPGAASAAPAGRTNETAPGEIAAVDFVRRNVGVERFRRITSDIDVEAA